MSCSGKNNGGFGEFFVHLFISHKLLIEFTRWFLFSAIGKRMNQSAEEKNTIFRWQCMLWYQVKLNKKKTGNRTREKERKISHEHTHTHSQPNHSEHYVSDVYLLPLLLMLLPPLLMLLQWCPWIFHFLWFDSH